MPRAFRLLNLRPSAPPAPIVWHLEGCACTDCNPPAPSDPAPSLLASAIENVGCLAFGLGCAWLLDRALDGPGIQIMFGF